MYEKPPNLVYIACRK